MRKSPSKKTPSATLLNAPGPTEGVLFVTEKKDDNWILEALEEEERVEHGLPAKPQTDAGQELGEESKPKNHGANA